MSVKHIGSKTFYVVKDTTKPNNNVRSNSRDILTSTKREAIIAATDFGYGFPVIERIRNATSVTEVSNIMKSARKEHMKD